MGQMVCPETSVNNYQSMLRNISQEQRRRLNRGESLKSRNIHLLCGRFENFQAMPVTIDNTGNNYWNAFVLFVFWRDSPPSGPGPPHSRGF